MTATRSLPALAATLVLSMLFAGACAQAPAGSSQPTSITGSAGTTLMATPMASFDEPWAMTFLPDGRLLVTEKPGRLLILTLRAPRPRVVAGVPDVDYGGQGGLGDVTLHPGFADNGIIYLSYAEAGDGNTRGAAVARARLVESADGAHLDDLTVIWRQTPKVTGRGHYGHRLAFAPDGHLFITSGERQKFTPAQDLEQNLGKIIRLRDDGSVPPDNPFAGRGDVAAQVWSLGQRNPLGIAFAADGRLWAHEMGPAGGDELNLIRRGSNYGYPLVSNGNHYDGRTIPDHATRPDLQAPAAWWTPVISPAGLVIYGGDLFPDWRGQALIGGLSSRALIRVALHSEQDSEQEADQAREVERFAMGRRIREVEQGPDGALWVLEDRSNGRLLRLTPAG
ncbi:MAG: PQQ-dependent sugar dehydrogenase [Pseudomonadales bacterium]